MKITRDLTIVGFAKYQLSVTEKQLKRLQKEVELLKNSVLRDSQQNFKIRRK